MGEDSGRMDTTQPLVTETGARIQQRTAAEMLDVLNARREEGGGVTPSPHQQVMHTPQAAEDNEEHWKQERDRLVQTLMGADKAEF